MTHSSKQTKPRTLIVGGGISGLSLAFFLYQNDHSFVLFEKNNRCGGVIQSRHQNDFVFEHGPSTLTRLNDETKQLLRQLNLKGHLLPASDDAENRFVLKNGSLHRVPTSFSGFLSTDLLSLKGKLRLGLEPFIPPSRQNQQSIADFVERRLGIEALDYLVNPFIAGVYAGKPAQLDLKTTFPPLHQIVQENRSLFWGAIKKMIKAKFSRRNKANQSSSENSSSSKQENGKIHSFPSGLQTLPNTLQNKLSEHIRTDTSVEQILKADDSPDSSNRYRVIWSDGNNAHNESVFDNIILTTPADQTASLLKPLDQQLSTQLEQIPYCPLGIVHFGFRQFPRPLGGFGMLVPRVEQIPILGTLWNGSIFPDHVPKNGQILTSFIGGTRYPEYLRHPDQKLVKETLQFQKKLLNFERSPDIKNVVRWEGAIPQPTCETRKARKTGKKFEQDHPGIYISGNFMSGVALPDCIQHSSQLASRIVTEK